MTDPGRGPSGRRTPERSATPSPGDPQPHAGDDSVWDGSDAQLAELAMTADPGAPLAPDAVPWRPSLAAVGGFLPEWYMPAPTARSRRSVTAGVIAVIVLAFVLIDASGLCVTSGFLSWA
ncbi:MAG TPA: hypothetical protein VGS61_00895 [Acidimicrobiales bacterium]|nr:hypothetical protein [Acidimicrobiales bacterium]